MTPATVATRRGPTRSCHSPPTIVPTPRKAIARVKLREICVSVQPVSAASGDTKTLHPYAAPRQTCMTTAAAAMAQRLTVIESWCRVTRFSAAVKSRSLRAEQAPERRVHINADVGCRLAEGVANAAGTRARATPRDIAAHPPRVGARMHR